MGIITNIEVQKKNKDRVNIYIDGEYACAMYLDFCMKYHLKSNMEISEEDINKIVSESDTVTAQNKALSYVSKTPKTISQVKTYLKDKGFEKNTISCVIEKLCEYHYLSDEDYVRMYVNTYKNKYGKRKLEYNLIMKGIKKDLLEQTFNKFFSEEEEVFNLAEKFLNNKEASYENLARVSRRLLSRGFSYEEIRTATDKLKGRDM